MDDRERVELDGVDGFGGVRGGRRSGVRGGIRREAKAVVFARVDERRDQRADEERADGRERQEVQRLRFDAARLVLELLALGDGSTRALEAAAITDDDGLLRG